MVSEPGVNTVRAAGGKWVALLSADNPVTPGGQAGRLGQGGNSGDRSPTAPRPRPISTQELKGLSALLSRSSL